MESDAAELDTAANRANRLSRSSRRDPERTISSRVVRIRPASPTDETRRAAERPAAAAGGKLPRPSDGFKRRRCRSWPDFRDHRDFTMVGTDTLESTVMRAVRAVVKAEVVPLIKELIETTHSQPRAISSKDFIPLPEGIYSQSLDKIRVLARMEESEFSNLQVSVASALAAGGLVVPGMSMRQQRQQDIAAVVKTVVGLQAVAPLNIPGRYADCWPIKVLISKWLKVSKARSRRGGTSSPGDDRRDARNDKGNVGTPGKLAQPALTSPRAGDTPAGIEGDLLTPPTVDDIERNQSTPDESLVVAPNHTSDDFDSIEDDRDELCYIYICETEAAQAGFKTRAKAGFFHPAETFFGKVLVEDSDSLLHGHQPPISCCIVRVLELRKEFNGEDISEEMPRIRVPLEEEYTDSVRGEVAGPLVARFNEGIDRFLWPKSMLWNQKAPGVLDRKVFENSVGTKAGTKRSYLETNR